MALVLIGRGVDGATPVKLNLNNVQLDKIFHLDMQSGVCRFKHSALAYFLRSANFPNGTSGPPISIVKSTIRRHLQDRQTKTFLRGKYELWLFWKALTHLTRQLSDRELARKAGVRRATPTLPMTSDCAVESLSGFAPCPESLDTFLRQSLPA